MKQKITLVSPNLNIFRPFFWPATLNFKIKKIEDKEEKKIRKQKFYSIEYIRLGGDTKVSQRQAFWIKMKSKKMFQLARTRNVTIKDTFVWHPLEAFKILSPSLQTASWGLKSYQIPLISYFIGTSYRSHFGPFRLKNEHPNTWILILNVWQKFGIFWTPGNKIKSVQKGFEIPFGLKIRNRTPLGQNPAIDFTPWQVWSLIISSAWMFKKARTRCIASQVTIWKIDQGRR